MKKAVILSLALPLIFASCKKEGCTDVNATNYNENANKDNGSCTYGPSYVIPATYAFTDASGNSTVNFAGQTDRINQAIELINLVKTGTDVDLNAQVLKDMFANTNGNGNGAFTFTSTRQLKDKCFELDQATIEAYFDALAATSLSNDLTAASGQAGILTSINSSGTTSKYLFDANGKEYKEIIEKSLMTSVFLYQALNVYLTADKLNCDNSAAVNASAGQYYTEMEHYFDEAFGYLAVPTDFPTTAAIGFWGKYCNSQNATLNSNEIMMANFKKGRAAIVAKEYGDRDAAITEIKKMWEKIAAYQAMKYLSDAVTYSGTDQGKTLHVLNEAYGFVKSLKYMPADTRMTTNAQVDAILAKFDSNFWDISIDDINAIKADIDAIY